jgi:hypothetical protein
MDKFSYNLKASECMSLSIQTKDQIFYLDHLGKSLDLRIQRLRLRMKNTNQKSDKLAPDILENLPVKCKKNDILNS